MYQNGAKGPMLNMEHSENDQKLKIPNFKFFKLKDHNFYIYISSQ
jgi:hypothetical protein